MATSLPSLPHDSSYKSTTTDHINRSLERSLDEATYTGEILLSGRKLREFGGHFKCDLSDTITAG